MQERSFDKYYVTFLQSCWNICIWPVLPSPRICPYFYGNSTCNPQYGNAVVDSASLKKSKPISKSFNLKQLSVSNWLRTMPGDQSVDRYQLAADQHLATRYYMKLNISLVAWHALSVVGVQFGGLCLVFNDHWVWATKFPQEGEKSLLLNSCHRGVYRREFRRQKRAALCLPLSLLRGLHHRPWRLQRHNPPRKMHLWVFEFFELCILLYPKPGSFSPFFFIVSSSSSSSSCI